MYKRKTKRRLFYASGLISLVLLPLICYLYLETKYKPTILYTMEIVMPESAGCIPTHVIDIKSLKNPDFEFWLTGGINDLATIDSVKDKLLFEINRDSTNFILQVNCGDKTKYWEMIKLFDMCKILGLNRYAMFGNSFRVYYSKNEVSMKLDYQFDPVPAFKLEPDKKLNILSKLKMQIKNFHILKYNIRFIWPSIILYLILLILTFRKSLIR